MMRPFRLTNLEQLIRHYVAHYADCGLELVWNRDRTGSYRFSFRLANSPWNWVVSTVIRRDELANRTLPMINNILDIRLERALHAVN